MLELREQFIESTVARLTHLHDEISAARDFPDSFVREIFRQIHTVKGAAQTFGFESSSRIAHELEDVLADVKNDKNTLTKKLLLESIAALKDSFGESDDKISAAAVEKIRKTAANKKIQIKILPELPESVFKLLSATEIEALATAFAGGKNILYLETHFLLAEFRNQLLEFRRNLEKYGEIIATLSGSKKDGHIGFCFLFAGKKSIEDVSEITEKFGGRVVFDVSPIDEKLLEVFAETAAHGEAIAAKSGKKIEFEIRAAQIPSLEKHLPIIFDALIHLTRNAVAHGIETPLLRKEFQKSETGKITIELQRRGKDLEITVSDDGRGFDLEKIRDKAVQQNVIAKDDKTSEREMLELIFVSGVSTADKLSDVSGRGVGLDALKNAVESAGGRIEVSKGKDNGAIFKIVLPTEN